MNNIQNWLWENESDEVMDSMQGLQIIILIAVDICFTVMLAPFFYNCKRKIYCKKVNAGKTVMDMK